MEKRQVALTASSSFFGLGVAAGIAGLVNDILWLMAGGAAGLVIGLVGFSFLLFTKPKKPSPDKPPPAMWG